MVLSLEKFITVKSTEEIYRFLTPNESLYRYKIDSPKEGRSKWGLEINP